LTSYAVSKRGILEKHIFFIDLESAQKYAVETSQNVIDTIFIVWKNEELRERWAEHSSYQNGNKVKS